MINVATIEATIETLNKEAGELERAFAAPVFTLGHYNRLVKEGADVCALHKEAKKSIVAGAEAHAFKVQEVVMTILPESNKLWDFVSRSEDEFGANTPETKRAHKEAEQMERLLQEAYRAYVNM